MLFVFPSQKDFVLAFRRGEVPSGAERFTPTDSPANFPEDPPILPIDSAIEPSSADIRPSSTVATSTPGSSNKGYGCFRLQADYR